jgi:hypothetical protein
MSNEILENRGNRGDLLGRGLKNPIVTLIALCAFLSGIFAIVGIIFLFKFYSDIEKNGRFGTLNDIMVIIQYVLMVPIAIYLYRLLRPTDPRRARNNLIIGLVGMTAVIGLQLLLVLGVITFAVQIGFVIVGFFIVLGWFLRNRSHSQEAGEETTPIPQNKLLTILAGLVFGYPVWAYQFGRKLLKMQ